MFYYDGAGPRVMCIVGCEVVDREVIGLRSAFR